jgi:predicted Zn-dependent protease
MTLDRNWGQLSDVVHKAMTRLGKKDSKLAEAFLACSQTTEIAVRNSEIIAQNRTEDSGVGFRVAAAGNRVGFACTNELTEKAILEAGERALAIAQATAAFPDFTLPSATRPASVKHLFTSEIPDMTIEQAVDVARWAVDAATNVDRRVTAKDGRVVFVDGRRGVINTLGVDLEERETRAALTLGCVAEQQSELTGSCYASTFSRGADLKPEEIGRKAGQMAVDMLGPKSLKSFQGPVIFGPEAVSFQICDVLIDAVKAENVASGRSAWTGKLGESVVSECLSVSDNAMLDGAFASRGFDDEGCSSQNTCLLSKGQLESFLHHATTAKALGQRNTGNASRFSGGFDMAHLIIGEGYRTKPEVYPSNLVIQPGTKTTEALVSELPAGILIESLAGFAQRGSGVISAQLSRAFFVRDGEIQHPIKGSMISGTGFEWLKHVSGVSKEVTPFQNVIVPSLRVENVKVVGI